MAAAAIPRYSLYGEPGDAVAERFIHIETIACRSGAAGWTIRPHAHGMLDHLLVVAAGGGEMRVEGRRIGFGRALLTVPAGAVHGFRFEPGTDGHVVTVAEPLMRALAAAHPAVASLRAAAHMLPLADAAALAPILAALAVEAAGGAPLAGLAGEALLQLLLVAACRLLPGGDEPTAAAPRRAAMLVARFRTQLDRHLRDGWSLGDHARCLGTSTARLRAACAEVAGIAPLRLLHDRQLAEARRQLAYTDRTVAEIGYDLGFEDPAYFSRFFRRGTGVPPAGWRSAQAAPVPPRPAP